MISNAQQQQTPHNDMGWYPASGGKQLHILSGNCVSCGPASWALRVKMYISKGSEVALMQGEAHHLFWIGIPTQQVRLQKTTEDDH